MRPQSDFAQQLTVYRSSSRPPSVAWNWQTCLLLVMQFDMRENVNTKQTVSSMFGIGNSFGCVIWNCYAYRNFCCLTCVCMSVCVCVCPVRSSVPETTQRLVQALAGSVRPRRTVHRVKNLWGPSDPISQDQGRNNKSKRNMLALHVGFSLSFFFFYK